METKRRGKIHEDDEGFDRVVIETVPRFKTSGLSGDEWRTSARITVFRKGEEVHSESVHTITLAAARLPWLLVTLPKVSTQPLWAPPADKCYQPGCDRPAVSTYEIKKEFCVGPGNCGQETEPYGKPKVRRFCERHLRRGDCGLEDADVNYTVLEGPGPNDRLVDPVDVSPSAFGGVVDLRVPTDD